MKESQLARGARRGLLAVLAAALVAVLVAIGPELRRYLKMERM
jgi:hypothetical protein